MNENDYEAQLQQARLGDRQAKQAEEKKEKAKKTEEVKFPLGMMIFAGIVDASDWVITLLIAGTSGLFLAISLTILNIVKILAMITLYLWEKSQGIKRSDPLSRYLVGMLIEILPFFNNLPTNIGLVFTYYIKRKMETKIPLAKLAKKAA